MLDFFTNIVSGGMLGAATSMFGTWMQHKDQQEKNSHEVIMVKANSDATLAEIQANVEVSRTITEGQVLIEEAKAEALENVGRGGLIERLTNNYLSDSTLNVMLQDSTWVGKVFRPFIYAHLLFMDAIRGLIRPAITAGVIGYVMYIVHMTLTPYVAQGNMAVLMDMVTRPSVTLLLFSASTVIGFWFADKSMAKRYQAGKR